MKFCYHCKVLQKKLAVSVTFLITRKELANVERKSVGLCNVALIIYYRSMSDKFTITGCE